MRLSTINVLGVKRPSRSAKPVKGILSEHLRKLLRSVLYQHDLNDLQLALGPGFGHVLGSTVCAIRPSFTLETQSLASTAEQMACMASENLHLTLKGHTN